jgi:hypothetical protein
LSPEPYANPSLAVFSARGQTLRNGGIQAGNPLDIADVVVRWSFTEMPHRAAARFMDPTNVF